MKLHFYVKEMEFDDETMVNPILRRGRRHVPYKCGVNKRTVINKVTGRPMEIRGDITLTKSNREYCNDALSWQNIGDEEIDDQTEKFINRVTRPINGPKNRAMYNRERSAVRRNLESGRISYDEFVAGLDKISHRNDAIVVNPYTCEYDEHNKASMYRMFRAIRNLELELDMLKGSMLTSEQMSKTTVLTPGEGEVLDVTTASLEYKDGTLLKGSFVNGDSETVKFSKTFKDGVEEVIDEKVFRKVALPDEVHSLLWDVEGGCLLATDGTNYFAVTLDKASYTTYRTAFDDKTYMSALAMQRFMSGYDAGKIPELESRVMNTYTKAEAAAQFTSKSHTHDGLISGVSGSLALATSISSNATDDEIPTAKAANDRFINGVAVENNATVNSVNGVATITNSLNPVFETVRAGNLYPVGTVYISTVDENPESKIGFGTWSKVKDEGDLHYYARVADQGN